MEPLMIAFIGIALGVFARTMIPYWKKVKNGETIKFDHKFTMTAITSFVLSLVAASTLLSQFHLTQSSWLPILIAAFLEGWTANHVVNSPL